MNPEKGINFEKIAQKEQENVDAVKEENRLNREKREEVKNEKEISEEKRKLQIFLEAIGDAEYYISGGTGLEFIEGGIKHRHGDLDIIVFEEEVEKIKRNLESKGFIIDKGRGWGGHSLDARNFEVSEESDEPHGKGALHIGIFIYKRNIEKEMAQQLDEDGSITKEFPLGYFNKEKQIVDYEGNKLTIADLRMIAGFKIASEREKDIKDIERIKPIFESKYTKEELEELKDVSKKNVKTLITASIKHTFSNFMETKQEVMGENIHDYFSKQYKEATDKLKNEKNDYYNVIIEFIESLKEFSPVDKDEDKIKKGFLMFISEKLQPIIDYHNNRIDKMLK